MATAAMDHGHGHGAHVDGQGHPPTTTGLDHKKVAVWAFIGSECMLFASLISTYMIYKGRSAIGPFPHEPCPVGPPPACPVARNAILNIPVTSASTFVLLMSSLAMVLALAAVENKERPLPAGAGWWTRALASSKLWLFMTALLGIDMKRGLGPRDAINVDIAALYWHFVDVVWIAIFTLVYLIR